MSLEKLEVLQHRMVGEADLAHDAQALRLGLHAAELNALVGVVNLDAVEHAEEIEVPPGAADSPSVASLRPSSSCFLMIFSISRFSTALSSAGVIAPFSRLARASFSAAGRKKLPT